MPIAWEDTLAAFNPKGTGAVTITKRTDVAGDQTTPWISKVELTTPTGYYDPTIGKENNNTQYSGTGQPVDVWWAMNFYNGTTASHFLISVHIDYDKWGNKTDGPLSKFNHQAELILDPIRPDLTLRDATTKEWAEAALKGNDTIDPRSLLAAATGIDAVVSWLKGQAKDVRDWAAKIDGPDSGWQGDAAGEFKTLLERYAIELDGLRNQLEGANYGPYLKYAAQSIGIAINAVSQTQAAWYAVGFPYQCILEVLTEAMAQRPFYWTGTAWDYNTPLGDPQNDNAGFLTNLDKAAKKRWLEKVHTMLDAGGDRALSDLGTAYAPLIAKLRPGLLPVGIKLPPTPAPDPNNSGSPPPGTGGGGGGGGTGGKGDLGLGDGNQSLGAGGGGGGSHSGSKPPPLPPPPIVGPPGSGTSGGGSGTGTPIRDKNGNILLDKDKKPILLPPGGYIGAGGKVYDANGKEVLGKDGKPIVVPQGSSVPPGTGGGIYGPNAKVPKGSTVREDGTVVDADGKPVLDSDGNPYVLEKGGSIAEDGTLLGADKKPISDYVQRSSDLRHAWNSMAGSGGTTVGTGGGLRPPPIDSAPWTMDLGGFGSGSGSGHTSDGVSFGAYPGLFGGAGVGGASIPTASGGGSGPRILGTSSGFNPGAIENSGMAPGSKAATAAAAEAAAAKEAAMSQKASALAAEEAAAMRGGSVATSGGGMPMMPPMGGMGGGMGGQGEKDRQRTTWLAEDEEVWGTETGAVNGVIGR
ncbi:WXG100 family type VII secretion target [Kitasatospora aureofaciens]|uniref:WXG100 family type VII secretion target n=1 Tax=Kitasatospora aureofaciens TaxID=1894 RepID=UPI001C489E5B|nr:hypothetical protein [Kitasatospora aureofaciens]MBV6699318.1 hypothetical protein [Kitasatospora aureofaciens]